MNIQELIRSEANVLVTVTPTDLKEFALNLIKEARAEMEKEEKPEALDDYLTAKETASRLRVSQNTLWRWKVRKYLVPIKVGNAVYYRRSDIEKIMKGG